jgi:putative salt-induced outer membrane protein YdiY
MSRLFHLGVFFLLAGACNSALGSTGTDRLEMSNGSLIIGRFVDADKGKVIFETDFGGTLSLDQTKIVSMEVNSDLRLQMKDGAIIATDTLKVADQTLTLDQIPDSRYGLDQLLRINPEPWEVGRGYRHQGLASTAFSLQRGNTVLDELDYRLESRWRSLKDRYTFKVEGEVREANRERTAENWTITGKYDRFQVGDYYWGLAATAEENRFADLDLRTTLGPYVGRSLFEGTPFVLELESGLSRVNEDFGDDNDDRTYVGLTWSVRSESQYFGSDSRLYVDHNGLKNLSEQDNLILNTTFGLSFPLLGQVQGATEVVLNYNSGAVAGTEDLDQTYRFRIGYTW